MFVINVTGTDCGDLHERISFQPEDGGKFGVWMVMAWDPGQSPNLEGFGLHGFVVQEERTSRSSSRRKLSVPSAAAECCSAGFTNSARRLRVSANTGEVNL